jgi:hypothetical protein
MSLDIVKDIFCALPDCKEWHAHLLNFTHSKRNGTTYNCRRIELEPCEKLQDLIQVISTEYIGKGNNRLSQYGDVREYDGTCNSSTIYKISEDNTDIEIDLDALFQGIATSDSEADPFGMKAQAYVLCGCITCNGDDNHQIKLVSMNTPITTLKNRFFHDKGKFWEVPKKVLNLRTAMSVIIYDRTVYFLDLSGETLFDLERAYKHRCAEAVDEIERLSIVSDSEVFRSTASSGQNPRRFAAFSRSKLELLKIKKTREKVAKYFNLPLTKDKRFDTSRKEDAESLVKILCGKAMWDVLEEVPVEVDGSKNWVS